MELRRHKGNHLFFWIEIYNCMLYTTLEQLKLNKDNHINYNATKSVFKIVWTKKQNIIKYCNGLISEID